MFRIYLHHLIGLGSDSVVKNARKYSQPFFPGVVFKFAQDETFIGDLLTYCVALLSLLVWVPGLFLDIMSGTNIKVHNNRYHHIPSLIVVTVVM